MNPKEEPKRTRTRYAKPELHRVQLTPEESLAAGCKTVTNSAPAGGPPCAAMPCASNGS